MVLPMDSHGVAACIRVFSRPMSRSVSMVRWLVMWARGLSDRRPYLVIIRVRVP